MWDHSSEADEDWLAIAVRRAEEQQSQEMCRWSKGDDLLLAFIAPLILSGCLYTILMMIFK